MGIATVILEICLLLGPVLSTDNYSCGGVLSQSSGRISSPSYPGNYPNNAKCVWDIEVPNNYRVTVVFTDVQLEGGCNYDYIEVFDGPHHSSPLLSRVCEGARGSFTSSSNSMSIRFVSDGSIVKKGFEAEYYPSLFIGMTKLLCQQNHMQARVSMGYLQFLGHSARDLFIPSSNGSYQCQPQITLSHVTFTIPYSGCGTIEQVDDDTITYSNFLKAAVSSGIIKRKKDVHIRVSCKMLQNRWVNMMYIANDTLKVKNIQQGKFKVNISFYTSSSFLHRVTSNPYYVDLNQVLYLQAEILHPNTSLALFADTCVASPNSSDFTSLTYDLIRGGCVKDETYQSYDQPLPHIVRFKFSSFHFLSRFPSMYLQCKMVVCSANNASSRCHRGCVVRAKRDVGSYQEKVNVILGPIQLQAPHGEDRCLDRPVVDVQEEASTPGSYHSTTILAGVFLVVVLVVAAFTLGRDKDENGHTPSLLLSHPNLQALCNQRASPREVGRNIYLLMSEQARIRTDWRLEVATKGKLRTSGLTFMKMNVPAMSVSSHHSYCFNFLVVEQGGAPAGSAQFGQGSGLIVLEEVCCSGNETYLSNCRHRNWNSHNCGHHEDINVICSAARPQSTLIPDANQ
ncbi:deleted in malignant brain tumors 1 protein-like [Hippopotamus amphibius kiboko]|uniref:deleted in malignant brain tumors 1 protein-like n=1 Tax=Hippopotamus amphibius kiboko TaxID=575201 RepID=UPI0025999C1C|nr:deleted in malignant brain tumors 1 protein-like [Hippopotamus amphibius kiboko]